MDAVHGADILQQACILSSDTGFCNYVRPPRNLSSYSLLILRGSRSLLKHLPVPDSTFAGSEVLGQLKRIVAEATEHTAREVVGKCCQVLVVGSARRWADNQVFRDKRAKIAGDAESFICVGTRRA